MATTTTNLGLTKPIGTEKALVSVINGNMDIIDNKVGAIPQNESVQSQITALNNQVTNVSTVTLASGITLKKLGKLRIISCANGSGSIPYDGIATGETPSEAYYSRALYFDGSSNAEGTIKIGTDGKLVLYSGTNLNNKVSGTYVSGELVYLV